MSLEISAEKINQIAFLYADLGPKAKKVLDSILWYIKKFPIAYPSQSKIAKMAGCSREYANRVLKRAADLGIICKLKRAYTTCRYFCEEWLSNLGIKKVAAKFFEMANCLCKVTQKITIVGSNSFGTQGLTQTLSFESKEQPREKSFPYQIDYLPVSWETKNILQCFSLETVDEALQDLVAYRRGTTVHKPERYLIGRCLELARRKGEKPDWKLKI